MSSANLGWLFYKDYYSAIDDWTEPKKSKQAISKKVDNLIAISSTVEETTALGNTHFKATTTYPGLILGSGNAHELPSVEGQAILGFHFDYTTGLPIIQGSSIKGVLRSAFPFTKKELEDKLKSNKLTKDEKEAIKILNSNKKEYILEYIEDKDIDIEALVSQIFTNNDIFFDAQIIDDSNKPIKILGDDYLAPHGDDPLKNPIPLRFIKVLPNISFRFDFELSDGLLTKEHKRKLFQSILEDLGLGAKTNVGYGKFCDFDKWQTKEEAEQEKEQLTLKKQRDEAKRLQDIEDAKTEKEQKEKDGINTLLDCKTLADGFKLLKDSFGKKPNPTTEQKEVIQAYYKKQKNLSKSDIKVFKKYKIDT